MVEYVLNDSLLSEDSKLYDKNPCKGIYYRCSCSKYMSKHGSIETRESYRLLKRMSCDGSCAQNSTHRCMKDWFEDDVSQCGLEDLCVEYPINPEDGAIYKLIVNMGSPDWETGYIEEWTWKLQKVNR